MADEQSLKEAISDRGLSQPVITIAPSPKRLIAQQLERSIAQQGLTRNEVARRMKTSRAALLRLLDGDNPAVNLGTIEAAAAALNLEIIISFRQKA